MLKECLGLLDPKPGERFADCTLGTAGHSLEIASKLGASGVLIGVDADEEMIRIAHERLSGVEPRVHFIHSDYRDLRTHLDRLEVNVLDGALVDMGVNSLHLDDASRGFSFRFDAPLDMRLDRSKPETAADLLARLSQAEIERMLREFGEERYARGIARSIVRRRDENRMNTTFDLVEAVREGTPAAYARGPIHPATRTAQAIRIYLNREIEGLEQAIEGIINCLAIGGRLVAITYHSLEDRAVKSVMRRMSGRCECPVDLPCTCGAVRWITTLTPRPLTPSPEEVTENPRARSAKLRAARKIAV